MSRHLPLISDMNELAAIFHKAESVQSFLQKLVELVARHMQTQVASVYLLNDDELVLKANQGLNATAINKLRIGIHEGLVGKAMKELRPILDNNASSNPHFKMIEGVDLDLYDSFLAVPIFRGTIRTGVLVVQRDTEHPFDEYDTLALSAIASQIAMLVEQALALMGVSEGGVGISKEAPRKVADTASRRVNAKGASSGVAFGESLTVRDAKWPPQLPDELSPAGVVEFRNALQKTVAQLELLQAKVEEKLSDVASLIFTSHLLMLKDPGFTGKMEQLSHEGMHPLRAVVQVVNQYRDLFKGSDNPVMQEKVQDVSDLGMRLVDNLYKNRPLGTKAAGRVTVARELLPSEILKLSAEEVAGIVLVGGGVTSHVAILARSLHIPLVIAEDRSLINLPNRTPLLLDGTQHGLWVNPTEYTIAEIQEREKNREISPEVPENIPELTTADGERIYLDVNVNLIADVDYAKGWKPDGIGLYRTEFPFMLRSSLPTEEEQYLIFRRVTHGLKDKPVTIRTLDVGGDKMLSYYDSPKEENPFLGLRSIRFALKHRELFRDHLRAILRAGAGCDLKLMFPVVSSIEEIKAAKRSIIEAIGSLVAEGIPCATKPKVGIMIEVPSVLELLPEIASQVDFFCLGTNDFVQYLLCVDRTNDMVADFYCSHHPAVVRGMSRVVDAATHAGIEISVCGDMAHHPHYIPLLIGLGVRRLSVDGAYLFNTRKTIEDTTVSEARIRAKKALHSQSIDEIADILGISARYHIS